MAFDPKMLLRPHCLALVALVVMLVCESVVAGSAAKLSGSDTDVKNAKNANSVVMLLTVVLLLYSGYKCYGEYKMTQHFMFY